MCAPCVEAAARARAAASDTPIDQRFNVTPMQPRQSTTPQVAAQPQHGDVVPVNQPPVTIPQDIHQLREAQNRTEDEGVKLAVVTINKPD
jgi:uncharacterized protein involved in high-affinity Fe2+ transport